jgi:hypothetical protein
MILYERSKAPPEIKLRFHIRDKFGHDIFRSLDYDTDTGVGHCYVPDSDAIIEYFKPGGYVEIDGHVNPSPEALDALYQTVKSTLNPEVMNQVIKKVEQDVRFNKGKEEQARAE